MTLLERDIYLTRFPERAAAEEYDRASEEIESLLERLPGIVAVYRAGGVSAPGISDIDRIAVVEGSARVPPVWPSLSDRTRYLAMHGPFLADVSTFRRHRWFAHVEPLELASGRPVDLEDPPLRETSDALIASESIVTSMLSSLKQESTGVFKVRPSLCQLNNLRSVLALVGLDPRDCPDAWQLADDIAELRRGWFELPHADRVGTTKDVAERAFGALRQALNDLGGRGDSRPPVMAERRLGPPWANVVLAPAVDERDPETGNTPRGRLPLLGSARIAELRWRAAHPKVSLPPAVHSLLFGPGGEEEREFLAARDALGRAYRDFLAGAGNGYAALGFAFPFLPGRPTSYVG